MKTIYYLGFLLIFVGCTEKIRLNENEVVIDKFPSEVTLKAKQFKIPPILLRPSNMCLADSFLIISQSRNDTIFSIFSFPDCNYLLSFGKKGKGPEEFNNSFQSTTLSTVYKNQSSFAVGNLMTKIQYYNISDLINKTFVPYRIESLPAKLNRFRSIAYIGDTLIFGAPYGGNMHLFKFNTINKSLNQFSDYPMSFPLMESEVKTGIFAYYMTVKPDNSKFVIAYANMGMIEIFDPNKGKLKTIVYKDFPDLEKNHNLNSDSKSWNSNPERLIFCGYVHASNNYIYLSIYNDKYSNVYNSDGPINTFIPGIHVLDWSGNVVSVIKLDHHFTFFDIDLMDKYLYTIDMNIENVINRYDLSQVLN